MEKHQTPKIIKTDTSIVSFPKDPIWKNTLYLTNFTAIPQKPQSNDPQQLPTKNKDTFVLEFQHFSHYCQFTRQYKTHYKRKSYEEDLLTLLYLIKYTNTSIYSLKFLIMENIFKPFLSQDRVFDSLEKASECKLKGGVYCIIQKEIDGRQTYIVGGWVFAVYDQKDLTNKNVISNVYDEWITCWISIGDEIITGYKSGKIKRWKIFQFHIISFVDCIFDMFGEVKSIYKFTDESRCYAVCDSKKVKIYKGWKEEIYEHVISNNENVSITASCYDWNGEENKIFIADSTNNLLVLKFEAFVPGEKEVQWKEIARFKNENNKPIHSLRYYNKMRTLFVGTSIHFQLWSSETWTWVSTFYWGDEINYLEYHIYKETMFLFCGGKERLHWAHFRVAEAKRE